MTEPLPPGQKEFYAPPREPELGHPETDPPMTVRVQDWARKMEPTVRRAIKTTDPDDEAWLLVTAPGDVGSDEYFGVVWLSHDEVRSWPITHGIEYAAAFQHAQRPQERRAAEPVGDMDVDAFKGGSDG